MSNSSALSYAFLILFAASAELRSQVVYSNDFESGSVAGWSTTVTNTAFQRDITISRTPLGGAGFLGDFGSQTVRFSTTGLPRHDSVIVELDLFVIRSWDGNRTNTDGPDILTIDDAQRGTLLRTTFSNKTELPQSYPDSHPGGDNPAFTGAAATYTLGYVEGDAIYRLRLAYPHSASTVDLTFAAALRDRFATLANESWGIDNIAITAIPPRPASALLDVDEVRGSPGDVVFVPIYARNAVSVVGSGATAVRTRMRFNASMLVPETPTPMGIVEGDERVIDLELPLIIPSDSAIARLNFRVVVGDDTTTAITLESSSAVGGEIALAESPGSFTVRGLCEDGGVRLFREHPAVILRAPYPNPASGRATVAYELAAEERVRLELVGAHGRRTVIFDGMRPAGSHAIDVDVATLPSGNYIVRMHTGSSVTERAMVILK